MSLRIVFAAIVAILLAGCNQEAANSVAPPPVALNSDAMGVFCGMSLMEHPGPKGQIITASRIDPFWFTSVRDTVAFTLMPDQPRDIRAIYVSDMARATSWEDPGATNWIDARKAFFVIESRRQGGMGAAAPKGCGIVPVSSSAADKWWIKPSASPKAQTVPSGAKATSLHLWFGKDFVPSRSPAAPSAIDAPTMRHSQARFTVCTPLRNMLSQVRGPSAVPTAYGGRKTDP